MVAPLELSPQHADALGIPTDLQDSSSATRRRRTSSDFLPSSLRYDGRTGSWIPGSAQLSVVEMTGPERVRHWRLWLLITISSVISSVITFCCSALAAAIQHGIKHGLYGPGPCLYRLLCQTFLALAAHLAAVGFTSLNGRQLGHFVGGSGIPELKCELGGVHLVGLFHWRILAGKWLGLAFGAGGGLPVGMEGPFVHAAGCVSHLLIRRVPLFEPLLVSRRLWHMATITSVAVGVACTFAAPLGGVLYALEVTDSFASMAYLHCFYGATLAGAVNSSLRSLISKDSIFHFELLFDSNMSGRSLSETEEIGMYLLFVVMGCFYGLLGAGFVRCHRFFFRLFSRAVKSMAVREADPPSVQAAVKRRQKMFWAITVASVGLLHSALTWWRPFFRIYSTQPLVINQMVSRSPIDWGEVTENPLMYLLFSALIKYFTSALVLALPLPMGAILPTFVIGALSGRCMGEALYPMYKEFRPGLLLDQNEFASRLAVVGASAFVAGSMHSFAQVIIVFELMALPNMLVPMCAASLAAIFVANAVEVNFFDSVIALKKLPHLPSLARGREALKVRDIMSQSFPVVPFPPRQDAVDKAMACFPEWHYEVPVAMVVTAEVTPSWMSSEEVLQVGCNQKLVVLQSLAPRASSPASEEVVSDADAGDALGGKVVVPLQVASDTPLRSLLPLLLSLDKNVAFVTEKDGSLVGAVSLTELYSRAVRR